MANDLFVADNTIPGISMSEIRLRAADMLVGLSFAKRGTDLRHAFRGADRRMLQDLGLDRGAC